MSNTTRKTRNIDATIRGHINTIGRDFKKYGGDVPMAIACSFYCDTLRSPESDQMLAVYLSKLLATENASARFHPIAVASVALHEFYGHHDWLIEALIEHSNEHCREAARDLAIEAIGRATEQLLALNDDPAKLVQVLLHFVKREGGGTFPDSKAA